MVEQTCKSLPYDGITIFSQALIVETINLGDLFTFMISSQNGVSIWKSDFESDEQCDSFYRVVTSINIVSHEKVVVFWQLASDFE